MNIKQFIQLSGPIFEAVQASDLFSDGKTFVDSTAKLPPEKILDAFEKRRKETDFDLKAFIYEHFELPEKVEDEMIKANDMYDYIGKMWNVLQKEMTPSSPYSTLIALPKDHIVPGGRFRECFYWDSYFTAIGLEVSGKIDLIKDMAINFAYLIEQFGFIPNGNRAYFASRSHPPYFSHLLMLLYESKEKPFALSMLSALEKEYGYWMKNAAVLKDDLHLNHYFDENNFPRPEAFKREVALSKQSFDPNFFKHLRSACASGWDFSSRWLGDQKTFETIHALDILPVDLNCLLYHM
ncbi:MAG: trehalase, partial [Simkaniaceae bacterium]|nr:trehalase [Simkaniaceae bacterium]